MAFAGMVHAFAETASGRAFLRFRKDANGPITVKTAVAFPAGNGSGALLLPNPIEITSGEDVLVDVTQKLLSLFLPGGEPVQERLVKIILTLDPEPSNQPGPAEYSVTYESGQIKSFSSH
jgi:hypothetical protein